jgi:hypothetical protein
MLMDRHPHMAVVVDFTVTVTIDTEAVVVDMLAYSVPASAKPML